MKAIRSLGVIGAGAWGTALAQIGRRAGLETRLWCREAEVAASIAARRENVAFLPGVELEPGILAVTRFEALLDVDVVLLAPPAQHLRATLEAFAPVAQAGQPIVLCAKGIERGSLKLMSEVLAEVLPDAPCGVLSGPSFAREVAEGLPAAVTLACRDLNLAEDLAKALATPAFRPYVSADVVGAEAGGALKNVLAIACGVVEGRGLGRSAHAALITRGFAELVRLGLALGAEAETLWGLCGLGDLVLTCSSLQSRNMAVGVALGRGQSLQEALAGKSSVAEGVESAPAVRALAARLGVEAPICVSVAQVLSGELDVDKAIHGLLSRPLRAEGL